MAQTPFQPRPAEGLKYPNVVKMMAARCERSPHAPALRHKEGSVWRTLSWSAWWDRAREIAAGLRGRLGLAPGQRVAILAPTRLEWLVADLAIAMAGGVSVPIYPSLTPEHVQFILDDSGATTALIEDRRALPPRLPSSLRHVAVFDEVTGEHTDPGDIDVVSWQALRQAGAERLASDAVFARELDGLADALGLNDPMTFVYTSGTTGMPKGVILEHRNLVYEAWAIKNVVPVDETDEQLLVLPMAHIFARHLVWGAIEQGAVTSIGEGEAHVFTNLQEVAPTFMGGVPRLYEKAYARVVGEAHRNPLTRKAFEVALEVGRRVSSYRQRGQVPPTSLALRHAVADKAFFSRIKAMFGGRLRFMVSGGAPLSRDIAEFFHACGILILEGYGLTETTGATNVNRPDRFRFGTVGPAMPGCEILLAEDGEILVRGHNVFAGYHNLPEETAAAFDERGWFKTGDIGELRDGFLRITDRKKDLFKTTAGKYVAPRMIEGRLRLQEGIAHGVVYGEGRPHAVALLALDEEVMMRFSEREGLGCRTYADLAVHPRVRQLMQSHVDEVNAGLARFEAIRRFAIVPVPFTEAGGELTPTRKVRRRVVLERYGGLVESLYDPDALPGLRRAGQS